MVEYFRRRAVGAAVVAGVVAFVGIFVLRADAEYLFHGLTSRALPLVILSALCGLTALVLLLTRRRTGAPGWPPIGAVASIVVGWGVAQWEYILPETLTVDEAAAPSGTIGAVIVADGARRAVHLPGLRAALPPRPEGVAPRGGRRLTAQPRVHPPRTMTAVDASRTVRGTPFLDRPRSCR